jgi:hypothetical protein
MGLQDRDYMHQRHRNQPRNPWQDRAQTNGRKPRSQIEKLVFAAFVGITLAALFHKSSPDGAISSVRNWLPVSAKEIALPESGNATIYQLGHSAPADASFTVVASAHNTTKTHHLVKLIDADSRQPVASVFVRSGETATIKVPFGSYRVNIASGEKWYGDIQLFGSGTVVKQGTEILNFYRVGNTVYGHTLTLAEVFNGNFHTNQMPTQSF